MGQGLWSPSCDVIRSEPSGLQRLRRAIAPCSVLRRSGGRDLHRHAEEIVSASRTITHDAVSPIVTR